MILCWNRITCSIPCYWSRYSLKWTRIGWKQPFGWFSLPVLKWKTFQGYSGWNVTSFFSIWLRFNAQNQKCLTHPNGKPIWVTWVCKRKDPSAGVSVILTLGYIIFFFKKLVGIFRVENCLLIALKVYINFQMIILWLDKLTYSKKCFDLIIFF